MHVGCSQLYLEGHGNWRRFLESVRKQTSYLSSRSARRRTQGTATPSASLSSGRIIEQILTEAPFKYIMNKMIRSCQCDISGKMKMRNGPALVRDPHKVQEREMASPNANAAGED